MSDLGTNHDRAILAAMQRRRAGESVIDLADDYTDGYPTRLVDQFADLGLRAFAEVERLRELLEWHTDDEATLIATAKGLSDKDRAALVDVPDGQRAWKARQLADKAKLRAAVDDAKKAWPGRKVIIGHSSTRPKHDDCGFVGPALYGDQPGQINTPAPMGDPAHQVVVVLEYELGKAPHVWHTHPELLDPADFVPVDVDMETARAALGAAKVVAFAATDVSEARPVDTLDSPGVASWDRERVHRMCIHHRSVQVPWRRTPVAVCLHPFVHDDGMAPTWKNLQEAYEHKLRDERATQGATPGPAPRQLPGYDEIFTPRQIDVIDDAVSEAMKAIPVGLLVALFAVPHCPTITMTDDGPEVDDDVELVDAVVDEIIRALVDGAGAEPDGDDVPILHWLAHTLDAADLPLPDGLATTLGRPAPANSSFWSSLPTFATRREEAT